MVDNVVLNAGDSGGATIATDDDGTAQWQLIKLGFGGDGTFTRVTSSAGLPVDLKASVNLTVNSHAVTNAGTFAVQSTLQAGTAEIGNVKNSGVFVTQINGAALTALQLIDDPVFADDAPFTLTTSKTMVAGAIRDDQTGTLAAAEGDVVPLRVDSDGHLHTHSHLFDPGTIDSFGHLLTASAANQIDIQFFRDTPTNLLTVTTAGGGATSQVGGAGKFETSTAGTANAKGVTTQSTSYRSGAEIFTIFTAAFTIPTDGNGFQRIGLYDNDNGMFIGFEGTSFGVTIRNGGSDTTVAKGSFSEDSLTGAVGSKFTRDGAPEAIDLTKFNVFRIRYGWLGSAPIGFEILAPDGNWVTMHQVMQPNLATVASIENPDLPMTLHVSKTSADATNLIMTSNCWGAGVTERALPLNETLTDDTLAQISRVVIVGKTAGGAYVNVQTTTSGNLKMALDEYDGVPTGSGTASGTLRVELPTDGTGKVGLNAGSALVGDVGIGVRTSGGTTIYKNIDVDAKDEVKSSAGQVYWIHAMNTTAAPVFLKFYDLAAANVTVGTTVPDLTFLVPANADSDGAGFTLAIPNGIAFGTGITIAGTGLVADNDNTALGANALIVNLGFA